VSENENKNHNELDAGAHQGEAPYKFAHVVGVSTPEDKYHSPGSDDVRSDAELVAMGVEPDEGPGSGLIVGTLLIIGVLVAVGFGTIELFKFGAAWQTERVAGAVDTQLADLRAASHELLTTPAALEGTAGHYRIPVTDAIVALDSNPNLLAGHPLGVASEVALPAGVLPPPPPPAPVFVAGMVDPLTGLIMLTPDVACIPGIGATAVVPQVDPITNLPLPLPPVPSYDLATCQLLPVVAEGSGVIPGTSLTPVPAVPDGGLHDGTAPHDGSGH
jgi:hypothetical protein